MTESLNKTMVRLTRTVQLPVVISGVLCGAAIVFGVQWAFSAHITADIWSFLPALLGLGIILLVIFFRFRAE